MVQGEAGEFQKLEMLQSQLQQGPIWAQRCPAWKADVQCVDACVIDREGEVLAVTSASVPNGDCDFSVASEEAQADMCMFDGAQSAPCNQPGRGMPCQGGRYHFPRARTVPTVPLQGSSHRRPARAEWSFGR